MRKCDSNVDQKSKLEHELACVKTDALLIGVDLNAS